jgi:hypothetical protein
MTPRDIITPEVVFSVLGAMGLVLLWHCATELKAIREILADIAAATRETAKRPASAHSVRETNRLLKLAIKKH